MPNTLITTDSSERRMMMMMMCYTAIASCGLECHLLAKH